MTSNELTRCSQPNELQFVYREDIHIYTYILEMDCESTSLHPSTIAVLHTCEYHFRKLCKTFWIPLYMSSQWLYVVPQMNTFTILCPQETSTVKLQGEGKLTLKPGCNFIHINSDYEFH
jgi:hypothetical protein